MKFVLFSCASESLEGMLQKVMDIYQATEGTDNWISQGNTKYVGNCFDWCAHAIVYNTFKRGTIF